jgi:RNA polymerase sigma-70 factor, ECF subfamily
MPGVSDSADRDFGRLLMEHRTRIYGYIRSLVVHRADAEDLLQETASVLWRKFDDFRPGSNFLAWALQVARYEVLKFRQRQKRNVLRFSEEFIDAVAAETVKESTRLADLQELVDQCLDKLPPSDRDLIELRYRTDVPVKSLAEQLDRPLSTIYDALSRIRRALVECMERSLNRAQWEAGMLTDRQRQAVADIDQERRA